MKVLTNEELARIAEWTLEDFQNDPLGAVGQVRELAVVCQDLQRERDDVLKGIENLMEGKAASGICRFCNNDGNCPVDNGGHCEPKWRRPQLEPVLAPTDQSAGAYADNPILAQA